MQNAIHEAVSNSKPMQIGCEVIMSFTRAKCPGPADWVGTHHHPEYGLGHMVLCEGHKHTYADTYNLDYSPVVFFSLTEWAEFLKTIPPFETPCNCFACNQPE